MLSDDHLQQALEAENGRPVAVKCFRKAQSRSFQLELHALMRVGVHPNVIRLFESYSKDEDALVLEYCDRSWAHEKL